MIAVFDASSLISMSQSCLINILGDLQHEIGARFVVPESVYAEVVEKPINIKRFELNAVRIKKAVDEGWLEIKALDRIHQEQATEIDGIANQLFFIKGRPLQIVQRVEIDALALLDQLGSKLLVIDERTARSIIEDPARLKTIIERRKDRRVFLKKENADALRAMFPDLRIVRSVELVALAFEKGVAAKELPNDKQALEAALYAVKYAGCAVSRSEIEQFLSGKTI